MAEISALVVNHTADVTLLLKLALQDILPGMRVLTATSEQEAQRLAAEARPDLAVIAVDGSRSQVARLVARLRQAGGGHTEVILMSNRIDLPEIARKLNVSGYVRRPASTAELDKAVRRVLSGTEPRAQREDVAPPVGRAGERRQG